MTTYSPADPERVLAHMASMSWIAALAEPERDDVVARMRAIVAGGDTASSSRCTSRSASAGAARTGGVGE